MIITLIFVGLFVFSGISLILLTHFNGCKMTNNDLVNISMLIRLCIGSLGTLVILFVIISAHCAVEKGIYDAKMERNVIVKQFERSMMTQIKSLYLRLLSFRTFISGIRQYIMLNIGQTILGLAGFWTKIILIH